MKHLAMVCVGATVLLDCGGRSSIDVDLGAGSVARDSGAQRGVSDGGPSSSSSSGGSVNGSSGSRMPPVACGSALCDPATQECCVLGMPACVGAGQCRSQGGLPFACTSSANCPDGTVCCAASGNTGSPAATCVPSCGDSALQLCASDNDCPDGVSCVVSPFGIGFCAGGGGGDNGGGGGGASG